MAKKGKYIYIRITEDRKSLFMAVAKSLNKTATEILDKKIEYIINKSKAVVNRGK
jgi:hypothetical protein